MPKRIKLDEAQADKVAGGAFQFYSDVKDENKWKCYVDGLAESEGDYYTTADGFFKYINLKNANPGANGSQLLQLCLQEGIIWSMNP